MIRTYRKGDRKLLSKYFKACEFDCHASDCSTTYIDDALVKRLTQIREHFGQPMTITSGYRCEHHNAEVGGAKGSYHKKGQAADIVVNGVSPIEVAKYAESIGILGIGQYDTFCHVDTRDWKSFWQGSWQKSVSTFGGTPTTPPDVEIYVGDNSGNSGKHIVFPKC